MERFTNTPRFSEFKTKEGKVLLFLVVINIIVWTLFAVLVGYTNIMYDHHLPQSERVIVYDPS